MGRQPSNPSSASLGRASGWAITHYMVGHADLARLLARPGWPRHV